MAEHGEWIRVRGARVHNLHNVGVDLPRGRLIVLTGPSGSGKSSLAFDTLYAEGQRRYLETLRVDTRALFDQLQRPDVDLVEGLPPTLCVAQQAGSARPRSTLATLTEIHDHLRLLYARVGIPHCTQCGRAIQRQTVAEIARQTLALEEGHKVYILAPLVQGKKGEHREAFQQIRQGGFLRARVDGVLNEIRDTPTLDARKSHNIDLVVDRLVIRAGIRERLGEAIDTAVKHGGGGVIITDVDDGDWHDRAYSTRYACPVCQLSFPEPEPRRFSFNNPYGACPRCTGLGQVWELDPSLVIPDRSWSVARVLKRLADQLPDDVALPAFDEKTWRSFAGVFAQAKKRPWRREAPLVDWPKDAVAALLHGTTRTEPPFPGLIPVLRKAWEAHQANDEEPVLLDLLGYVPCPECCGARLNAEARAFRFADKGLHEITAMSVTEATAFFAQLIGSGARGAGKGHEHEPARDGSHVARIRDVLLTEILHRLCFLQDVGLDYLTLDRPAPTLSGGELQRARLANHLGGGLLGVCYILDEPTIGLHPRDTDRLIAALRGLQQRGNTVIVVEHDAAVMREADYLVDLGPGAGGAGGRVLAAGTFAEVLANPQSVTALCLVRSSALRRFGEPGPPEGGTTNVDRSSGRGLTIHGARHHNLKNITVYLPLGRMICVTGVSGSGKSSLVRDILCYAARRHLGLLAPPPGAHDSIEGLDQIDKVVEVDQRPLGRAARSNPATYSGVYDEIRKLFATTRLAKVRGYKSSRFSFNVRGGRCERCLGQGTLRVTLQFLPDLTVVCPECRGRRFNRATLEVTFRGKSIADVLDMTVDEAVVLFANVPAIVRPLQALADVGLGYVTLGQPSSALSGGEAQRVKLAAELAHPASGRTLFILDEPTTGLHFTDIARLLEVLRKLVEAGNTVVVIEHNLEVIAAADWVIDLGPEGGEAGGNLVAAGTPADVAACPGSVTGRFLQAACS